MLVCHSKLTVLHCSSGTVPICIVIPKRQATICFEVLRVETFVRFGSWKAQTIEFRIHVHRSMIRRRSRSNRRL